MKPTDLTGLVGWYSADYEATKYAANATVFPLHDLSGAGNDSVASFGPVMK